MNYALIFAGGTGSRMGGPVPKQFLEVDNKPIIIHTVEVFNNTEAIDGIVIVCVKEYIDYCRKLAEKFNINKLIDIIPGGATGQKSIFEGLKYIYSRVSKKPKKDTVLINDGVRPIIDEELIKKNIECTEKNGNCVSVAKAIETIITVDDIGQMNNTIDRSRCRYAKAPQTFILEDIYKTHLKAINDGEENIIDSATLMSMYGHKLYTVECKNENIKITTPIDYYMFKAIYEAEKNR